MDIGRFLPFRAFLFTEIYINGEMYINYWSFVHLLMGVLCAAYLLRHYKPGKAFVIAIVLHSIWEYIQLQKLEQLQLDREEIVNIGVDTAFFAVGFAIIYFMGAHE